MGKIKDISNKRFGKLIAIKTVGKVGSRIGWLCICDCGNETIVQANNIGRTTFSCGCEQFNGLIPGNTIHGMYGTTTYTSWRNMLNRCIDIKNKDYIRYGGRGIRVCEAWFKFENFHKDMGNRPANTTIDRINNNGNYEPSNCRWASNHAQVRNRRNNVFLEYKGERLCISDWAKKLGLSNHGVIAWRLKKGWTLERTLTTKTVSKTSY